MNRILVTGGAGFIGSHICLLLLEMGFEDRRPGDNAFVVPDNSLARSILKWEPKRNIEKICEDGWKWQLKNPKGYE